MLANIGSALSAYQQTASNGATASELGNSGASFGDTLTGFMKDSVDTLKAGEKAATDGATGKADIQSVVFAVDKASKMLDTLVAIRDKVVTAYEEIMRTQI